MNNNSTHTIRTYRSKNPSISTLARNVDGMVIGAREGNKVAWGEDPRNQQGRTFVDEHYAMMWLRRLADADQIARKGMVCKDCGMVPADSIECSGNEDKEHRIDRSVAARLEEIDGEPKVIRPN